MLRFMTKYLLAFCQLSKKKCLGDATAASQFLHYHQFLPPLLFVVNLAQKREILAGSTNVNWYNYE